MQNLFVGSWLLVSATFHDAAGVPVYPLGERPVGFLTYDGAGFMAGQLANPEVAKFGSPDPQQGKPEELRAAYL